MVKYDVELYRGFDTLKTLIFKTASGSLVDISGNTYSATLYSKDEIDSYGLTVTKDNGTSTVVLKFPKSVTTQLTTNKTYKYNLKCTDSNSNELLSIWGVCVVR